MNNPFETINARLNNIESLLLDIKHKPEPVNQTKPDTCFLIDAIEITGLSKSKIYKLTASNEIPHKKFGNRLRFSRKELLNWVEFGSVDKSKIEAVHSLASSARRKLKGGSRA